MTPASPPSRPWYVDAFDRRWLELYPHRNDGEARANASAVAGHLGLRAGESVLDVSCGAGRYARAMAALGMRVTGVDLSDDLLQEARLRSGDLPGAPSYYRCDARHLPFARQFRGAMSMFTSFGYFDGREDDVAIFRGVARALVRGGRFLIDFLNESQVRATLVHEEMLTRGPARIAIRRRVAEGPFGPAVYKSVQVTNVRGDIPRGSFEERVRLYDAAEVVSLLEEAGLHPLGEPMGDLQGAALEADSPRLILVAEKR